MQLLPQYTLQLLTAGWFSLIYGLLSITIIISLPKARRKRILAFPKFINKSEKIFTGLALFIFGRGLIVYSFFIPLELFTLNFYIGTAIYLIGMASSVYAMWTFSQAEFSRPVTKGIYKVTRHPMQVMTIVMWVGIGIASGIWLLVILAFLLGALSYPSLKAQERFCIDKYGEDYLEYIERTPRYLLII